MKYFRRLEPKLLHTSCLIPTSMAKQKKKPPAGTAAGLHYFSAMGF
jgi:hypothetical protein